MRPGSVEWKEARKTLLTASDMAAACGLNPYCSRQELWRRKVYGHEVEINPAIQWGMDHEKDAISSYEAITGSLVTQARLFTSTRYPGLGCTPDGLIQPLGLLEAKCPSREMYKDIPIYYLTQMVGQLAITEREVCHFVVWTPQQTAIWQMNGTSTAWEWMLPYLNEMLLFIGKKEKPPRFRNKPDGEEFKSLIAHMRIF